ncbi:hypothetical protein LEP1GSC060_3674 [Leptospira weilii serovar Ranarum str. ICFT]|uniref:Uncharacterized protein n=1 Tax=Leptospira weilii serovar Ranarum str. ICFT TaxID=1218598 RepID=N1WTM7_9LEPT|nr:hypothetical protein LEP1GSC060_3674 [Leptospira weilii serovar Ranarum str. ICFT]
MSKVVEFGLFYSFNDFKETQTALNQSRLSLQLCSTLSHLGFLTPQIVHIAS